MTSGTHLRVLLFKNFLTLRRNLCFAITFVVLPIICMGVFVYMKKLVTNENQPQSQHLDSNSFSLDIHIVMFYSTTDFQQANSSSPFTDSNIELGSFFSSCVNQNLTQIALIVENNFNITLFDSTDELFNIVSSSVNDTFCFGLQINAFDTINHNYSFSIMCPTSFIPSTNNPPYDNSIRTPNLAAFQQYENSGFVKLYSIISKAILMETGNFLDRNIEIAYLPIMTPEYVNIPSETEQMLALNFPTFFMFTYLIPFYYIVSKLAEEKQSKSREGMKMMGLSDLIYTSSWILLFFSIMLVMGFIITVMLSPSLFQQSSWLLLLLLCLLYGMALFGESVVVVALLPNVRSSATASTLWHIITYFLVFAIQNPQIPFIAKFMCSLLPNIAMSFCIYCMFNFEFQSTGLTFSTAQEWYGNYTYAEGLSFLAFDFVFYVALGMYLEQVLKTDDIGVARPWYFLCTRKFCCKRNAKAHVNYTEDQENGNLLQTIQDEDNTDSEASNNRNESNFEAIPESMRRQEASNDCLKVRGLRKLFGTKAAVDGVSLTMYNGQIFALLGHNGAGKTTTISMLTGLLEPTKGKASVFGIDVFEEQNALRKIMGVCPQHDVLFDYLTPREHLRLFAAFKGTPSSDISVAVDHMIQEIDLVSVADILVKTLSGGQKRKLSVGIAMIGNSKVIILDEPTSGMDTASRRRLWEMLKQNKHGKIIILTTHYMDEADILGDRIAIMAEGKVRCCGSSLFLKNRFGVGYNLVITKMERIPAPQIDKFIFTHIPNAKKLQEVSSEITFQLPTESSSLFKEFFNLLDSNLSDLSIVSYGVGITTLEEVFLKIAKDGADDEPIEESKSPESPRSPALIKPLMENNTVQFSGIRQKEENSVGAIEDYSIAEMHETGALNIFMIQFAALFKKKIVLQFRDPRALIIEIFFPIILIVVGLALGTVTLSYSGQPRLMSPTIFPSPNPLLVNKNGTMGGFTSPQTFIQDYFILKNKTEWDVANYVNIRTENFTAQISQLDNAMFLSGDTYGPYFGNYYIYNTDPNEGSYAAAVLVNTTSQDATGVFGAQIYEAFLQHIIDPELSLTIYNQPLPQSLIEQGYSSALTGTFSSILFAMAYMMISKSLAENIIRERERNIKHQILVSGAGLPAYWLSNYVADILFEAPPSLCAIGAYLAFGLELPDAWILFIVFIFTNPIFVYCISTMFAKETTASIMVRIIYIILGCICPLAVIVMLNIPSAYAIAQVFKWFFYIFPIYALDFGIMAIADMKLLQASDPSLDGKGPLDVAIAGPSLYFMIFDIFFYWGLLALIEYGYLEKLFRKHYEIQHKHRDDLILDNDVLKEEQRIEETPPEDLTVRVNCLNKHYGSLVAVEKLSFGLEYGECFALLGVTGAGKTTTFKCLTGEEKPTNGQIHINGNDVTTTRGFEEARRLIGYCPQFDAICENMTVKEHLMFYAKIKGVLRNFREDIVNKQIQEMDLQNYVGTKADKLSGGNKRKLSVAMAMIGNPPIVFLDEPSTGVDPKAKRFMWTIVSKISTQRKKSSVIITTHSMEEAEALCTKMAIMVEGNFKCYGSSQHIKDKFGTGYEIEIKIRTMKEEEINDIKNKYAITQRNIKKDQAFDLIRSLDAAELILEITPEGSGSQFFDQFEHSGMVNADELIKYVFTATKGGAIIEQLEKMFTSLSIIEQYNNSYKLKVSRDQHSIGFLFGFMEDIKNQYDVSEYSVCQTTLEQIFNNFAKEVDKGTQKKRNSILRRSLRKTQIQESSQIEIDVDFKNSL